MKKLLSLAILVSLFACSSIDDGQTGAPSVQQPLIAGDLTQPGVTYLTDLTGVSFEEVSQDGDSTFYRAAFDLNGGSSDDIIFDLVKWTDTQLLTCRTENGFFLSFAGSDHEVFSAQRSFPIVTMLAAGTSFALINNDYRTEEDFFFAQELQGSTLSAGANNWNNVSYLPFVFQGIGEGWVGLQIESGTGNDITGLIINTIAIR